MIHPESELIWTGRMHLGDEPGIYGNASYVGLSFELPIMLRPFSTESVASPDATLVLSSEEVKVYPPYRGHIVTITSYEQVPSADPAALPPWRERPVCPKQPDNESPCAWRLTKEGDLKLDFDPPQNSFYYSVRVRVDTTVTAGLYDDFLITRLGIRSKTHYASFGFDYLSPTDIQQLISAA
jgi:hypothetical protein